MIQSSLSYTAANNGTVIYARLLHNLCRTVEKKRRDDENIIK